MSRQTFARRKLGRVTRRQVGGPPPHRLLVGIDFSALSLSALDQALGLARQFGGKVALIHVVSPQLDPPDLGYLPRELIAIERRATQRARRRLAAVAKKLPARLRGEILVHQGMPGEGIAEVARELGSDWVVIATHGNTGLKRMLLGSTAENVVRHAPCPVLVVRPKAPASPKRAAPARPLRVMPIMP